MRQVCGSLCRKFALAHLIPAVVYQDSLYTRSTEPQRATASFLGLLPIGNAAATCAASI